jgi:hypothetical protein
MTARAEREAFAERRRGQARTEARVSGRSWAAGLARREATKPESYPC